MARNCDGAATKRFGSLAHKVFSPVKEVVSRLVDVGMTKARFNPRRKVIRISFTVPSRELRNAARRQVAGGARPASSASHFDDGVGKGLRRFLRQVMSDAAR